MADFSRGNHFQHTVHHSQTGAQNRDKGQLFAGNHIGFSHADGGFDFNLFQRKIPGGFVADKHSNFRNQLTEFLRAGVLVTKQGDFVLNQGMIHDEGCTHNKTAFSPRG